MAAANGAQGYRANQGPRVSLKSTFDRVLVVLARAVAKYVFFEPDIEERPDGFGNIIVTVEQGRRAVRTNSFRDERTPGARCFSCVG
jgi:hypothetical protein